MAEREPDAEDARLQRRRPPGYFACKRSLVRLRRIQDLIRHHQRWASQMPFARPLEELLPADTPEDSNTHTVVEREIDRLIPLVIQDLHRAGLGTEIVWRDEESDFDDEKGRIVRRKVEKPLDLFNDYFELPRTTDAATFQMVIRTLERAIGLYESRRDAAWRDFFNPIAWLAQAIRLPLDILERAGLYGDQSPSIVLRIYGWLVRVLVVLLIAVLLAKMGISVPWEGVLNRLLGAA